ncbi:unnamed protein product [Penicillium roqueforti FM164]|uniref:Genomic scaffold, ProqFM164S01 n=1 Tax=Penicillium roqueforti (strain FM164) TaxID=1365484 RepID=W6Q167_PENRF|nr:unnamed protein product [Penicillium roqueforti FM164]
MRYGSHLRLAGYVSAAGFFLTTNNTSSCHQKHIHDRNPIRVSEQISHGTWLGSRIV